MAEYDSVIPAGESGKLTARVKTKSVQSGAMSKSISVTTDAAGAERMSLSLTFKAVPAVAVLPRPQISLSGIEGDRPTASVFLRRGDGETLEITGLEGGDERLTVTTEVLAEKRMVARHEALPGDVVVTVGIAEGADVESANGRLSIETNHPDAGTVDVAWAIRMRPVIEARPRSVRLIFQEGSTANRMGLVKVVHHRRGEFRITAATPSNPELFGVNVIDGDAKQQVHNVAIMLNEDLEPDALRGRVAGTLVIATDDPAAPEMTIPVQIEVRSPVGSANVRRLD